MPTDLSDQPSYKSETRTAKIDFALARRQPTLTVVIENVHDTHNVNAILRSCDAVGILHVHLLYTHEKFPKLAPVSSSGAYKWLDYTRHDSVESCFEALHADGYTIFATKLDPTARGLYENDFTQPTAFVLGNEHRGISDDVARLADHLIYIPMMGMAESLNVSVANAVCLFEASRQRAAQGMYDTPQLSPDALRTKRMEWLKR